MTETLTRDLAAVQFDHLMRVLLEERIRELWSWRRWHRRQDPKYWADIRRDHTVELLGLLALRRTARRTAREAARQTALGDHYAGMPR